MPKQKPQQTTLIKSFEELISDLDRAQMVRALDMLKSDISWQVFRAALMKEYLHNVVYALDNSAQTGKQIEAAYKAGVAQSLYDTANSLIDKYKDVLENKVGVIQTERPEE